MSAFYSNQSYNNFLNEIMQQASQENSEEQQYQDTKEQAGDTQTLLGTELLAQSAPQLIGTIARVGSRVKSYLDAGNKLKTSVEKGIATLKTLPQKAEALGTKLADIGANALDKTQTIASNTANGIKFKQLITEQSSVADKRNVLLDRAITPERRALIASKSEEEIHTMFGKLPAGEYSVVQPSAGGAVLEQAKATAGAVLEQAKSIGTNALENARTAGTIARDLAGNTERFAKMSQKKLSDIAGNVKDKVDLHLSKLQARGQEITPQIKAKYDKVVELTNDKSPEGISKLRVAYEDFKAEKIQSKVSSLGKEAVSKLNPAEKIAKLSSSVEEQKAKVANFIKDRDTSISRLTQARNEKLQDLNQRRSTLQKKLEDTQRKQQQLSSEKPAEARFTSPDDVSVYRSGGSIRVPEISPESLGNSASRLKTQIGQLDKNIGDVSRNHTEAIQRVLDKHTEDIATPLAKIDDLQTGITSVGKTASATVESGKSVLGQALEQIAPALDIGFATQSAVALAHGGSSQPIADTLNDVNMLRHGASSAVDVGKTVVNKVATALDAGAPKLEGASADALSAGKDALTASKDVATNVGKDAINATKNVATDAIAEGGSAIGESIGAVLGPVGEIADAGLLLYSLISGISDLTHTPYIAKPPPQQINIVHQNGIY